MIIINKQRNTFLW